MNYKWLFIIIATLANHVVGAQTSSPTESADEQKTATKQFSSFDELGVDAWWQLVESQPAAEQAWLNLYLAERFERWGNEEKELSAKDKSALQDVQTGIEFNVPNSFADHYIRFLNSNYKDLEALELAEYSRSNDPLVLKAFVDYETIYGSKTDLKNRILKWGNQVQPSEALLAYSRNLLRSLPLNALVLTNGDDDTYPLLFIQQKEAFRKDVKIIQLDLMVSSDYRTKVGELLNCNANVLNSNSRRASFESILAADKQKRVALPFSLPGVWLKSKAELYDVRGLCLQAIASELNEGVAVNQVIWANMNKTYVLSDFQFARNYIPMLLRIYRDNESNEALKADAKQRLSELASITPDPDIILKLLSE